MITYTKKLLRVARGRLPKEALSQSIAASVSVSGRQNLKLGRFIHIGPNCNIDARGGVSIGDGSIIGPDVLLISMNHDYRSNKALPYARPDIFKEVVIGKGVWVGARAIVLPGVKIGDGAVVGAGAVVARSVSAGTVVAGNPAKAVGCRSGHEWQDLLAEERYWLSIKKRDA